MQLAHDLLADLLVDSLGSTYPIPFVTMPRGNVTFGVQMARGMDASTLPTGARVFFGLKATSDMAGPWLALAQLVPDPGTPTPGFFQAVLPVNTPEMIALMHADPTDEVPAVTAVDVYGQLFYFLAGSDNPAASQLIPTQVTAVLWNGAEGIAPSPNVVFPNAAALAQAVATAPASLAAVPARGGHVWVAPARTDAQPGLGTAENPLDGGSRAKFEAILAGLPSGHTLHLLPGTYHTFGRLGAGLLAQNVVIQGAGMGQTTIVIDQVPAGSGTLDFFAVRPNQGRVEVRDLTLDGNLQNQPADACVQAALGCTEGGFYSVHLKNWGKGPAAPAGLEMFGLVVGGIGTAGYYELIGNVVDAPANNSYGSALGINAGVGDIDATHPCTVSGLVFDNRVTGGPRCNGLSFAGRFDGLKVLANTVYGAARGFHQDTIFASEAGTPNGPMYSRNVTVAFNTFDGCFTGIGLSGMIGGVGDGGLYNYVSSHNEFRAPANYPVYANYGQGFAVFLGGNVYGFHSDHDHVTGSVNTLMATDDSSGPNRYSVENLRVARTTPVIGLGGTPLYLDNNRYEDGTPIQQLGERSNREIFSARRDDGSRQKLTLTLTSNSGNRSAWPSYEVHIIQRGQDGSASAEAVLRVTTSKGYQRGLDVRVTQLSGDPVNVALGGDATGAAVAVPDSFPVTGTVTLALLGPTGGNTSSWWTVTALGVPAVGGAVSTCSCALAPEDRSGLAANVAAPGRVKQSGLTNGATITPDLGGTVVLTGNSYPIYAVTPANGGTRQLLVNHSSASITITAPSGSAFSSSTEGVRSTLTIPPGGNAFVEGASDGTSGFFVVISKN